MNILVGIPNSEIRSSFMPESVMKRLSRLGKIEYNQMTEQFLREELLVKLEEMDAFITGWGQPLITADMLGENPRLKIIAHTGGTVGGIIDESVFDMGVKVISGNQYYAESVAEGVIAYMLFALRKMGYYSNQLKQGVWTWNPETEGLLDRTVGIVSLGAISKKLIRMAKPFRLKFKVYSTHYDIEFAKEMEFEYATLEEVFSTCEIVSVHTARNPQTENMIGKRLLKMMKDDTLFINTSRGAVVDENALIDELKTGRIRALLDVYQQEPLQADSELLKLDNAILFPHQAGPMVDRRKYITNCLIDDIESFFEGKPIQNEITADVARRMTKLSL